MKQGSPILFRETYKVNEIGLNGKIPYLVVINVSLVLLKLESSLGAIEQTVNTANVRLKLLMDTSVFLKLTNFTKNCNNEYFIIIHP